MYTETQYNNSLYHFGIKGMHWGKRNGPPYPLGYSDHTAEERRQIDNRLKTTTSAKTNNKKRSQSDHEISENTKKIIIAAAASVGIGAAVYLGYKYNAVSKISNLLKKNSHTQDLVKNSHTQDLVKNSQLLLTTDGIDEGLKKEIDLIMKQSISEVDTIIKKETIIKRQVGDVGKNYDLKKAGEAIYTTFKESDAAVYRQILNKGQNTKRYEVVMEAMSDIKMPSDRKAIEIFQKVWDENPTYKEELIKSVMGVGVDRKSAEDTIRNNPFSLGMYTLVRGNENSKIFYEELRKQGYNAVRDYWDSPLKGMIDVSHISDFPTIILDPVKHLKVKNIKDVTDSSWVYNQQNLDKIKGENLSKMRKDLRIISDTSPSEDLRIIAKQILTQLK